MWNKVLFLPIDKMQHGGFWLYRESNAKVILQHRIESFAQKMTTAQIHTQERIQFKASSHQAGLILYSWKNFRDPQGICRRLQSVGLAVPSEENQSEPFREKDRGRNGVKFKARSPGELWESRRALQLHSDRVKLIDFLLVLQKREAKWIQMNVRYVSEAVWMEKCLLSRKHTFPRVMIHWWEFEVGRMVQTNTGKSSWVVAVSGWKGQKVQPQTLKS